MNRPRSSRRRGRVDEASSRQKLRPFTPSPSTRGEGCCEGAFILDVERWTLDVGRSGFFSTFNVQRSTFNVQKCNHESMTTVPYIPAYTTPETYLNASYRVKSWLLTIDHKRIAILYMLGVTFFFILGGAAAVLMRLELMTPAGDLVQAETYNKLFTMHGVMMVFFFLIPAIPAVLGNFLVPLMIGARDLAFPKINLFSWYLFMFGGLFTVAAMVMGGVDTGWTFYTPYSSVYSNTWVVLTIS